MKKSFLFILALFVFLPQVIPAKGHLLIIGGGDRPDYLAEKIYELAGGGNARIVIIPNASEDKIDAATYTLEGLKKAGFKNYDYIMFDRNTADADSNLAKLDNTTAVYFTGGDQIRITRDLLGTKMLEKIRKIYADGGVISGTSAGAAIMSKIMLTGNELINKDTTSSYFTIQKGNIETVEGLGFVTKAIIDQHFITRKRLNRLISVVLEHPDKIGIGIDESTSIIVNPDDTFDVLGESLVMVFDATNAKNISTNKKDYLSASGIKLSILKSGDKYSMTKRTVIK